VEPVGADETPAVIIIRRPTVLHPHRFRATAEIVARTFTTAVVRLAQLRWGAASLIILLESLG
jgi:hypothetical protein